MRCGRMDVCYRFSIPMFTQWVATKIGINILWGWLYGMEMDV
jgi:hypothetical protein